MSQPDQIWGTVSVQDHLRPQAFVAELLLFETLVVPRPPSGATWPAEWDAAQQERVLGWLPPDRVMDVPWDETQHDAFEQKKLANGAQMDIENLQATPGFAQARDRRDFEDPLFHMTRMVLQDHVDKARNRRLLAGVPKADVAVIPAYNGPKAFRSATDGHERLFRAFNWEFLVPHDETADGKRRSHQDLIKAALDLCAMPEVQAHRTALRVWTSAEALRGTTVPQAQERMEALIADYAKAIAATKLPMRVKWGAGIAEFLGAAAAIAVNPAFALLGPAIKLGEIAAQPALDRKATVPEAVKPAALIHDARASFTGVSATGPDGGDDRIRIADHWPRNVPLHYV